MITRMEKHEDSSAGSHPAMYENLPRTMSMDRLVEVAETSVPVIPPFPHPHYAWARALAKGRVMIKGKLS